MIVYLVRHGHTHKRSCGVILSNYGHTQAELTAHKLHQLCEKNPRKVFTSKMERAIQTAAYFGSNTNEHAFLGEYKESVESFENFMQRVLKCERELRTFKESIYIIYGHSIFISALLSVVVGANPKSIHDLTFRLDHCSISKLKFENNSWKIHEVNNTNHIQKLNNYY
jgi:broad specificity phosphatase PhoE